MPITPATRLVSDVVSRVKRQFGDEAGVQITDTDIIRWVNDGQLEITKKNKVLKSIATTPSIAGTNQYLFPGINVLNIEQIQYKGVTVQYRSFNDVAELILQTTDVTQQQGPPSCWYEWDDAIYFFPTPNTAGDTITMYYINYPVTVTSTSDALSIPDNYYEQLIQYCMTLAYETDDDLQSSVMKGNQFTSEMNMLASTDDGYGNQYYRTITVLQDDA